MIVYKLLGVVGLFAGFLSIGGGPLPPPLPMILIFLSTSALTFPF
jgi:uncharacterized membrane protein YfcA